MRVKNNMIHQATCTDWWLYAIVGIVSIYFTTCAEIFQSPDTKTYISAWVDNLSHGDIDAFRTPVYPIYLGIMMLLSKVHYLVLAVAGQHIVFIISLFYLKEMISWFTGSHFIEYGAVIAYALFVINWNNYILTESFAISGIVFLFYHILSYYRHGKNTATVWATIWLAFLIFLRPAFLFLFPACLIAWGLFHRRYGKNILFGIFGVILVGTLEICYCSCYKDNYGMFLPSKVSITNNFEIAVLEGAISPEYTDNDEVKEYINRLPDFSRKKAEEWWKYNHSNPAPKSLDTSERSKIVSKSKREQPVKWVLSWWHHFFDSLTMRFPVEGGPFSMLLIIISGTILMTNSLLIIYFLFCSITAIKNKKIPVVSAILWITVMGNFATIIIGAQAEWARLLSPSIPLLTLMIVQLLGFINWKAIMNYNEEGQISK